MLDLVLFVSDERLEEDDILLGIRITDRLCDFERLIEISIFVVTLSQI